MSDPIPRQAMLSERTLKQNDRIDQQRVKYMQVKILVSRILLNNAAGNFGYFSIKN